jgi:hypothetical protein
LAQLVAKEVGSLFELLAQRSDLALQVHEALVLTAQSRGQDERRDARTEQDGQSE